MSARSYQEWLASAPREPGPEFRYSSRAREIAIRLGYRECPACPPGSEVKGPIHCKSGRLWTLRRGRAEAHGGTDPVSGVTVVAAEAHLALTERP